MGFPVLVTTAHRGVFFGYLDAPYNGEDVVKLRNVRLAVYWSKDVKGFLGLATAGPTSGCRIGPPALTTTLKHVTSVSELTPEAIQSWESAPWSDT